MDISIIGKALIFTSFTEGSSASAGKSPFTLSTFSLTIFKNAEIFKNHEQDHPSDPTGESKIYGHYFEFKSGAAGKITCVDFSKKIEEKRYEDHLRVTVGQEDYTDWLINEAYK